MMRPCQCNKCEVGKPWSEPQCWPCWLANNYPHYARLWTHSDAPPPPKPRSGIEQPFGVMPSLLKRAINYGKAVIKHAWNGFAEPSTEELTAPGSVSNMRSARRERPLFKVRLSRSCASENVKHGLSSGKVAEERGDGEHALRWLWELSDGW